MNILETLCNAYDFLSKYFDQIIENDFWYNFEDNIFD